MNNLTETIGDRVRLLCDKYFQGNVSAMSRAMGKKSSSTLTDIIRDRKNLVEMNTVNAIIMACPDVSKEWIMYGTGSIDGNKNDKLDAKNSKMLIPFSAMAGYLNGENLGAMEYECEKYIVPEFENADFLTRIQGDSMEPEYFSGDIVACKKVEASKIWFQWGKTYVISTTQGALIKIIKKGIDDEHITAVSINKDKYEPFQLPIDEIHEGGIAIVIGLIRII